MTADLVTFLRARLDEDGARAKAAGGDSWRRQDHPSETVAIYDSKGEPVVYDEGSPTEEQAAHITRHDPARVLAEVDAKREVVRLAERAYDYHETFTNGFAAAMEHALRLFALPYADHADYREEWRP